jgi:hypothetical protein
MCLSSYWQEKFHPAITKYYPFAYMLGAFLSFWLFNVSNRQLSFWARIYGIPIVMVLSFGCLLLIGEFIPKGSPKDIIFLATVFFQGFSNELMQFTIFRYVVNFGYGDVSKYNNGSSISSVFTSLLALMVFVFVEDNFTAALLSVIAIGFVMIACV